MKVLDIVVAVFLIIGGINWGFVGFFDVNPISSFFGEATAVSRLIYALVGFSALYDVFSFTFGYKAMQHRWCETAEAVKH